MELLACGGAEGMETFFCAGHAKWRLEHRIGVEPHSGGRGKGKGWRAVGWAETR